MTLPIRTGDWTLDQAHTTVGFTVRHLGISRVRGRFTGVEATVHVGPDLPSTTVRVEVDLATVNTDNPDRDAHLRSSDFFSIESHPMMVFESGSIEEHGQDRYRIDGHLHLNGRVNPLALDVDFLGTATFPGDGSVHAGFTATGSLSRKAFGVDFNVPLAAGGFVIADQVNIEIDVQLLPAVAQAA